MISAEVDATLTVGAAPGCRLLPIKWESNGPLLLISDSKFMAALMFTSDKVDVISNSWGNSPDMNFSSAVVNRVRHLSETSIEAFFRELLETSSSDSGHQAD